MSGFDLDAFEAGELDPARFSHRAHVEAAFAMLSRLDFLGAARRYQAGIEQLALQAGAPQKANVTITLAFLSVIAERKENLGHDQDFLAANPDLLDSQILKRWYSPARLTSPLARRIFLMPDRS